MELIKNAPKWKRNPLLLVLSTFMLMKHIYLNAWSELFCKSLGDVVMIQQHMRNRQSRLYSSLLFFSSRKGELVSVSASVLVAKINQEVAFLSAHSWPMRRTQRGVRRWPLRLHLHTAASQRTVPVRPWLIQTIPQCSECRVVGVCQSPFTYLTQNVD